MASRGGGPVSCPLALAMTRSTNVLTPHQAALLEMICREDLTNAEAAQRLGRSPRTIMNTMTTILLKMGKASRTGACWEVAQAHCKAEMEDSA